MHGDVINDVHHEVGNDKSDADDDDHVVFARNVSGHSLTDCPIITWRTFHHLPLGDKNSSSTTANDRRVVLNICYCSHCIIYPKFRTGFPCPLSWVGLEW